MRSKWIRYSSSSAERSPFWARSTSLRMWSVDSRAGFSVAPELTGSPFPGLACGEPDTAGALETPEIRDLRDDDVVGPALRLEHHDARPVLVERPLELVGRRAVDEAGDHLAAVEADLYPYAVAVRHATPPPRELRGPIPDGRRRPGTRTCPGAARRRSARRPAARDPRALRGDRRPRRRRDACRGHGWRENAPPASRRRAARAAPRDRPRSASTLPRRPVPRRAPGTRAALRTGARTSAPPRRDPRRRRRRGGFRVPPPGRCYPRWVEWGCGSLYEVCCDAATTCGTPTDSDARDSDSTPARSSTTSSRTRVSFSSSRPANRSSGPRCFWSRRTASAYAESVRRACSWSRRPFVASDRA